MPNNFKGRLLHKHLFREDRIYSAPEDCREGLWKHRLPISSDSIDHGLCPLSSCAQTVESALY